MALMYQWTPWNLTPGGWQRGVTVDSANAVPLERPEGTLLSMLSTRRPYDPGRSSHIKVVFRSPDDDAIAEAMGQFGPRPRD
jgi:hypothetical protein